MENCHFRELEAAVFYAVVLSGMCEPEGELFSSGSLSGSGSLGSRGIIGGGSGGGSGSAVAGASAQTENHHTSQEHCEQFLHFVHPPFLIIPNA